MSSCCVYGCTNRQTKNIPGISFHRIPRNKERRAEWIKAIRRENWMPSPYTRICSAHFKPEVFDRSMKYVLLKENAVPTIFEAYPAYLQNEIKTSEMAEETTFIKCEPEWGQDACGTPTLIPSDPTGSGEYPEVKDEPHTEEFSHEMMEEAVKSEPDWKDSVCEDIKTEITIEEDVQNIWKDHCYVAENNLDRDERDPDEDGVFNSEHGKDILCKLCNKTFTKQHNLVKHMLQHSGIKTYACELCPKVFKQQSHLTQHVLMHTKKCFICSLCNESFADSAQLDAHSAVHIGKRGYVCSECNKSFIDEHSLQPINAEENKYSCPECRKKLAGSSSHDQPPVGNNSEKTYACLCCMKTFAYRSSLRYHMAVHRKKQPHDCTQCEKNFQRKSALLNHLKRRHSLQERDPLQ